MAPSLRTRRLDLSVVTGEDLAEMHAVSSDPETHTIGDGPVSSIDETAAWIRGRQERYEQRGLAWYAVRERDGGRLLGNAGLFPGRAGASPEIGYEIAARSQGQGYATEAAGAVLRAARGAGWTEVWATVRPANLGSRTVLARHGFRHVRIEDDHKGPLVHLRWSPRRP